MVCKVCQNGLILLLQLYANLPEHFPNHERRLYVFGCRRKACQRKAGCIRAFRNVKYLPARRMNQTVASHHDTGSPCQRMNQLGNAIFGTQSILEQTRDANPFAIGLKPLKAETSLSPDFIERIPAFEYDAQPMTDKIDVPQILLQHSSRDDSFQHSVRDSDHQTPSSDPRHVIQGEIALPKPFPLYYLEADFETIDHSTIASTSLGVTDLGPSLDDSETFESTLDKVFQRFADRLAQNPLQVLRYEFSGIPILYSDKDDVGRRLTGVSALQDNDTASYDPTRIRHSLDIPACENCGSKRIFEMQLTPYAISLLEANEIGLDGMEWGTIIVGVCESDCIRQILNETVGYLEEWVGVQWEET